ncbi:MAG: Hsp20/alpha crystallin family protein [Devosia sp.]|uniref:Hsp20/alpha crystallin family protein n=1 Tax=Devosia sp. TaxID=1871048 RepID=UPI001AC3A7D4|nr:Hsp20/alpha crystallin family protein [Devosia sp.]MBN9310400.1 Hsp20/alpha crystallin family protein [Devosia sp.]MBN9316761.1 Hsp20/alpha crystallin family protein [Devosia sp.]
MAETVTRLPVKSEGRKTTPVAPWHPLEDLRREVDRLFSDFNGGWLSPLSTRMAGFDPMRVEWNAPAVDVVEKDKAFEITAELPGIDAKNVEVTLRNGNIVIRGEKQEEKEEKSKDYYLQERQFGSFERSFALPDGIDTDKIDASFSKGVLTVTLPKSAAAQKPEKKISVKAA